MGITGDKGDKGEIGPQGYLVKMLNYKVYLTVSIL